MSRIINLGIIGSSEGNGHPYSWSAIFNGYNKKIMENCGYPSIPRYLEKQKFPNDQIKEAKVTHIWTQNKKSLLQQKIASKINLQEFLLPKTINFVTFCCFCFWKGMSPLMPACGSQRQPALVNIWLPEFSIPFYTKTQSVTTYIR